MFSPGHYATNLLEIALSNEFFEFSHPLDPRNQNDFAHRIAALERIDRVSEHRPVAKQGKKLVESHSLTAARGDDDGAQHSTSLRSWTLGVRRWAFGVFFIPIAAQLPGSA